MLSSNHRLIEWLHRIKLESNNDTNFLNKLSIITTNLPTILIPIITSSNISSHQQDSLPIATHSPVTSLCADNFLTGNVLIIDNIVEINTNDIPQPPELLQQNDRTIELEKDQEINKLRNELRSMHNKLQKTTLVEKEAITSNVKNNNNTSTTTTTTTTTNETTSVNTAKFSTAKVYQQNIIGDQIDCREFTKDGELNIFFKQKLLESLGNVWFNKGIKFQMPPINKKIFYYICKNSKIKTIKCPSRCIVELNLDTNMALITHNAKSHNEACKRAIIIDSEKLKNVEKKKEENEKLIKKKKEENEKLTKLKDELKQLKKKTRLPRIIKSKKSKRKIIVKLKSSKLQTENPASNYRLRTRSKNNKSNQEEQDEKDLDEINKSSKSLDDSGTSQKEDKIKEKKTIEKETNSNGEMTEGVINERDLALLAEEFDDVLDKSNLSSKQADNINVTTSNKKSTSSISITPIERNDENQNSTESKKTRKRKRKSSANNENDKSLTILNKSMPQRPKTILSDKYANNLIVENVDCSSITTESGYAEFFKKKLTEYVGSNWTVNGNARFITVENKIIHYYACVKNKIKAISCPIKCIIELDLNTKLARFMHNGSQHNHDQNQCANRLTLNHYQKNIIAQDIDCQLCISPKDYDLFFQKTLSQLLAHNWLKQNDTKLNEKDNKSTHYYVCTKNKNKSLKCPSKCFIELDLNTNKAIVMHNGKEHNHEVEPFKAKTQQPQFSCYVSFTNYIFKFESL